MRWTAIKKLWVITSRKRYTDYLRGNGLSIGNHVYFVNPFHTHIDTNRGIYISIGNECVICNGVSIIAHDYSWTVPMKALKRICPSGGGTILIGNNCFIGQNATILKDVCIGDNVIIAAGAVVTTDCISDSVYAGVPARRIMSLDEYASKLEMKVSDNLVANIERVKEVKKRKPTSRELGNFLIAILDRNEENVQLIRSMSWIGCDKDKIVDIFLHSNPDVNLKTLIENEIEDSEE